jgi:FKBP-type peptidyl-prolyl cis-trans isomerase
MRKLVTLSMFALLAFAAQSQTKKTAPQKGGIVLKSKLDSLSYSLGVNTVPQLNQVDVDTLNFAAFAKGLEDAMRKRKLQLTSDQISMTLNEKLAAYMKKKNGANEEEGTRFCSENKKRPGVITTASGLQYEVVVEGTGPSPTLLDTVVTHYKGSLLNGQEFDNSYKRGEPISFPCNGVIRGWTEALQLMKKGSKYKLYIPAALAYGDRGAGQGQIPGGSTLIFDVELIDIKPAAKK